MGSDPQSLGGGEPAASGDAELRTLRLEAQLSAVTARVFQLEREVAVLHGVAPPVAAVPLVPEEETVPGTGAAPAAAAGAPRPAAYAAAPTREPLVMQPAARQARPVGDERSLETRVGSQWFNRIGILAVLIGMALFLKLAFDNHWIGAMARVLIGLVSGAALIAWSERFRAKGYVGFSYSLKAVGSGVLYLSLWAAFSMYQLIPAGVAFAGMVLVTVANAFIAWRQSAELLAVYAIVGAFLTPLLLSTGHNEEGFLFSYLLLMNAATTALLLAKNWDRLLALSFLGTAAFFWGWYWQYYATAAFWKTAVFLSLFFLLFAAATVLAGRGSVGTPHGDRVRVLVSVGNAAFGFLGFYAMLAQEYGARSVATAWCAIGFGVFYLGVRKAMDSAPLAGARLGSLADVQLAIAAVFFTVAVPLGVHGNWVTVAWMAESTALVWLAARVRTPLTQMAAIGGFALGISSLARDATGSQTQVIWNTRFLTFVISIAAIVVACLLARRAGRTGDTGALFSWPLMADVGGVIANALAMIAVLLEIATYWTTRPVPEGVGSQTYGSMMADRHMAEGFSYSAWFLIAGAALLVVGFRRRTASLRWQGLVLLAVTILKVFLWDTSTLSHGYRSVSFLALGALLLAVSFAYQRDWLHLRAATALSRDGRQ
jgi:uncharacterized membrane protein